jgi:predicted  nucleic acid-binding Zn-ribbon protein
VHLEISQSADRINQAIAPYRRFVQSTQQELTDARGALVATEDSLLRLRTDIEHS